MDRNTPFAVALAIGILLAALAGCTVKPHDADSPDGAVSGLYVYTDHLTGCQYLRHAGGGIIQRFDGEGRHVGCKR